MPAKGKQDARELIGGPKDGPKSHAPSEASSCPVRAMDRIHRPLTGRRDGAAPYNSSRGINIPVCLGRKMPAAWASYGRVRTGPDFRYFHLCFSGSFTGIAGRRYGL
jgi:hypothetical protein